MKHVLVAALALHLVACSSELNSRTGDGGPGASGGSGGTAAPGGSGGTAAPGGSGGGMNTCGPGDQDCICPGGYFVCQNDRTTCICPPQCTSSSQCGADAICFLYDGNCGGDLSGYCLSLARASQVCNQRPTCGCDGNLYDSSCATIAARVSPSAAPTSDCTSQPLPCGSGGPSGASCHPSQYCMVWNHSGSISESCGRFDTACAQPSCDCIAFNAATCSCELLPSGIVRLTCES